LVGKKLVGVTLSGKARLFLGTAVGIAASNFLAPAIHGIMRVTSGELRIGPRLQFENGQVNC